jgi:hypothetical protein
MATWVKFHQDGKAIVLNLDNVIAFQLMRKNDISYIQLVTASHFLMVGQKQDPDAHQKILNYIRSTGYTLP